MRYVTFLPFVLAMALFMASPISSNTIRPGQPTPKQESPATQEGEELKLPVAGGKEAEGNAGGQLLSITSLGKARNDITGKPLRIPENSTDVSFLDGGWSFEKDMLDNAGNPLRADFSFDKTGKGTISMLDQNNVKYDAPVEAEVSDGVLRMRTGQFTSKDSSRKFNSEFIECRNDGNGVLCEGTDGFGKWSGERVFAAKGSVAPQPTAAEAPAAPAGQNYVELSDDGAELSPTILAKSEKARAAAGAPSLGVLEGDWRFSQDLARKSDGGGVALEFHFDKNGNGYSVIKDGSPKEFRAPAKSILMPDGTYRVKTDAYENGSDRAYYPTFMECGGKQSQELKCNVSNGWMRIEDGRLVSINSYEKNVNATQMEELQATEPTEEQKKAQEAEMADLFAGVNQGATSPQNAPELVLPEKGDSVSFLAGSWLCKTDLARTSDNQPIIVQFTFDKDGKGVGIIREQSGEEYKSSARASYRKGILRINTSQFDSPNGRGSYSKSSIECRDEGGKALCQGNNAGINWEATFLRQK